MTFDPMDHPRRCRATNRAGERCRRICPEGFQVCRFHGGASPQVKRKAKERLADKQAQLDAANLLARLGSPEPLGHPVEELLALGAEVRAWQAVVRHRVADLSEVSRGDAMARLRESATIALYERSLDRSAKLLADLARLDLDIRLVRLREAEGQLVARIVTSALNQADVPAAWQLRIKGALASELRAALPA